MIFRNNSMAEMVWALWYYKQKRYKKDKLRFNMPYELLGLEVLSMILKATCSQRFPTCNRARWSPTYIRWAPVPTWRCSLQAYRSSGTAIRQVQVYDKQQCYNIQNLCFSCFRKLIDLVTQFLDLLNHSLF